ncbi:hypothetical protein AOQ84DRAFT_378903 [Glonium stellatum]|uniref:Uncharacterized protein n=1 Tax=Glonium stellatum TaxID=574774 RepID=A0A8E2EWF5_9PEZI|nr:hypothetical protein AOQ84DRAFT_378903 [Glonium stellatum]
MAATPPYPTKAGVPRPPSYSTTDPPSTQTNPQTQNTKQADPTLPTHQGPKTVATQFHLYANSGFRGRKSVTFKLSDKRTDAYFVDYRSGVADLVVRRGGPTGPTVGTIVFHRWSNYIELVLEGNQRVEVARDGMFTRRHTVRLPAGPDHAGRVEQAGVGVRQPAKQFFWKGTHDYGASIMTGGSLKLEDTAGNVYAAYTRLRSMSKEGRLNILVDGLDQPFVDQIVVSFMAVAEKERRKRNNAAAGSGGAGGGGGC